MSDGVILMVALVASLVAGVYVGVFLSKRRQRDSLADTSFGEVYIRNRNAVVVDHIDDCTLYLDEHFRQHTGELWLFRSDLWAFRDPAAFSKLYEEVIDRNPLRTNITAIRIILDDIANHGTEALAWQEIFDNVKRLNCKDKIVFRRLSDTERQLRSSPYPFFDYASDETFIFYTSGEQLTRDAVVCVHRRAHFSIEGEPHALRITVTAGQEARGPLSIFVPKWALQLFNTVFDSRNAWEPFIEYAEQQARSEARQVRKLRIRDEQVLRVCHISDLHFGVYHKCRALANTTARFSLTDYFLQFCRHEVKAGRFFDLLVVSGDITSICDADEYQAAEKFFQEVLHTGIIRRAGEHWDRVVLVPGNHDVLRKAKGGDHLHKFRAFIEQLRNRDRRVSSPFSKANEGACVLSTRGDEDYRWALHQFDDSGLQVATMITCQYAQDVDHAIVQLMDEHKALKERVGDGEVQEGDLDSIREYFHRRLRMDRGLISPEYESTMVGELDRYFRTTSTTDYRRLAVGHHNLCKYFELDDLMDTAHGKVTCEQLRTLGFLNYLHGHIHCEARDQDDFEVSATTLSGPPVEGDNGFNVLEWHSGERGRPSIKRYRLRQGVFVSD